MPNNHSKEVENKCADCTLIVSSCDAYRDLWEPFFALLFRFWPDCPFKIILVTETVTANIPDVLTVPADNLDWSSRLIVGVREAKTPYVLLMLEDFFLRGPVNTTDVLNIFEFMKKSELNMLRLIPRPAPDFSHKDHSNLGWISADAPFKVSTQGAFWRSSIISDLLAKEESIWMFEYAGSKRSRDFDGFVSVYRPVLTYKHHVVERGKWFPWYAWHFGRMQIGVNLTARPSMSLRETISWILQKTLAPFATRLPAGSRKALKPILQRLKIIS